MRVGVGGGGEVEELGEVEGSGEGGERREEEGLCIGTEEVEEREGRRESIVWEPRESVETRGK